MKTLKRDYFINFSFILPALIIFSLFYIYPFINIFFLSFTGNELSGGTKFVGWENFRQIFTEDKEWWNSVWHAGYITFWALTFQNFLALVLALCVDRAVKTGKIYRVLFFILPILSEIIIGLFWRTLLSPIKGVAAPLNISPVHRLVNMLGLGPFLGTFFSNPLNNPKTALTAVALVHCWKGFGWGFVILLAGLQTIPEELYEAARIDGAGFLQRFFKITLPLLMPVIVLVVILTILGTMQVFALIMALTRGGPAGYTEVPVIRIFNHLTQYKIGYASAEGLVLGLILIIVSFTFMQLSRKVKQT